MQGVIIFFIILLKRKKTSGKAMKQNCLGKTMAEK